MQDTEPGLDMAAQFWTGQAVFFRPVTRKVHSLPNKLKVLPLGYGGFVPPTVWLAV